MWADRLEIQKCQHPAIFSIIRKWIELLVIAKAVTMKIARTTFRPSRNLNFRDECVWTVELRIGSYLSEIIA